ncbi:hypothetical protein [Actinoplanes sp. NPDC051411]|uniref:hypothetical protein n=1 Tax=Actinoplanes sp. NPDC051411 TaxID=3155522 RepID=UPI003445F050
MQPQEPSTGQIPPPAVGPGTGAPPPKRSRARLWVAVIGGVVALLCLGGAGIVALLYNDSTKIERSAPDAVVDNFLRAYLVNRDDQRASLYQCKTGGDFAAIAAYRNDIESREKQFSVGIRVTWSTFTVSTSGSQGTVTTDLIKTLADQSGRQSNSWTFKVVDQDGWRVCGASALS